MASSADKRRIALQLQPYVMAPLIFSGALRFMANVAVISHSAHVSIQRRSILWRNGSAAPGKQMAA